MTPKEDKLPDVTRICNCGSDKIVQVYDNHDYLVHVICLMCGTKTKKCGNSEIAWIEWNKADTRPTPDAGVDAVECGDNIKASDGWMVVARANGTLEHVKTAETLICEGLREFLWEELKNCPERWATVDKIQKYVEENFKC